MAILQKTYTSEKETVIEALEDIESFIDKMTVFQKAYPNYSYEIDIKRPTNERSNVKWIIDLKVMKNEQSQDHTGTEETT